MRAEVHLEVIASGGVVGFTAHLVAQKIAMRRRIFRDALEWVETGRSIWVDFSGGLVWVEGVAGGSCWMNGENGARQCCDRGVTDEPL